MKIMNHFARGTVTAICLIGITWVPVAHAANECEVRYAYSPSPGQTTIQTVDLDVGQTKIINRANAVYVENLKDNMVRVYRDGIGSFVELNKNGRDPVVGPYLGNVTLDKVVCSGTSAPAAPVPTVEDIAEAAFGAVSNVTVPFLNQINSWQSSALDWADNTAADWGSCPSNGAQTSYDQLQTWRTNVNSSIQQAEQIMSEADAARNACSAATNNHVLCSATYNTLPVHGWIAPLTAAEFALTTAITTMAGLQCPAGCSQTAELLVPVPAIDLGGVYDLTNPGWINARVCTSMNLGSIGFNTSAVANGNLARVVEAELPACTRTENFRMCTNWDLEALRSELQRLRLVPPSVGNIELNIPSRSVTVVSGVENARCQQALRVCIPGGNVTMSLNEGDDLFSGGGSCSDYVTVGCQSPPFGLRLTTRQIDVPDLARATVTWSGRQQGSIHIDLTRPDFEQLCRGRGEAAVSIPMPPVVSHSVETVQLPFLCTQPIWTNVVANP